MSDLWTTSTHLYDPLLEQLWTSEANTRGDKQVCNYDYFQEEEDNSTVQVPHKGASILVALVACSILLYFNLNLLKCEVTSGAFYDLAIYLQ